MFYLACTRFNNKTYKENMDYRNNCKEAVIYGPTFKIRNIYPSGSLIFVVEMNNETNKIEGIGLIKNMLAVDRSHKIYENSMYNRIIYKGSHWVSRQQLELFDLEINEILDNILFKGKTNLKRLSGITVLTEKLFKTWNYDFCGLKNKVKCAFLHYHKHNVIADADADVDVKTAVQDKTVEPMEFTITITRKKISQSK